MPDRAIAICVLEILREYSDEDNILTRKNIEQKLSVLYDLEPDRRTIYEAISLLIDLGYDISIYKENKKGYFLRQRDFEQSEILLLMDAIYSFPFIPAKHSQDLISKLQKQLSVHKRKKYRHITKIREERKTDNRQVFLNIEILDEAIQERKQVSFHYMEYGTDKKLRKKKEELYIINPYEMVFMNGHYYLVCNFSGKPNISLYRIDRIRNITKLDIEWDKTPEKNSDIADAVYAFPGNAEYVRMKCDINILDDIIDRFGTGIHIQSIGEKEIEVTIRVPARGVQFWALQYLPYVEVLEPEWLRKEVINSIKANRYGI